MTKIKIGSDFSGVGAFNQALIRLGIAYEEVFACDMDKYARQTFVLNYGEPKYYPKDVYEREIPKESLDIYMTSPPCQAFSMAGKRLGKEDQRGILFFNSLEFIRENKPRYFIFENVKGLLSHDKVDKNQEFGRTFQEWINYLGGKSINGVHTFFPYEDAVPYHIYFQVLNAKHYGIPQNRERIFIIGIRDDEDNDFQFPKPFPLEKRLKDVLEVEVDKKYFLSKDLIDFFITNTNTNKEKGNGFAFKPKKEEEIGNSITTKSGSRMDDNFILISTNNSKGFDILTEEDSLNYSNSNSNSNTRRGRIGKGIAQTLDTNCQQGVWVADYRYDEGLRIRSGNARTCITTSEPLYTNSKSKIRRLLPIECFRLMDFNQDFKWNVSDTQAYKQAGNSICVGVLVEIIKKLKL